MNASRCLLTIAGTDPTGGAGIQVDLNVFRDLGYHGLSVVTAVVAQNTAGVRRFEAVEASLVADQLEAVLDDVTPAGVKIGMVGSAGVAEKIASFLERVQEVGGCPVVFDPVLASSSSHALEESGTVDVLRDRLVPLVDVLTPNVDEAERLLGASIDDERDFEEAASRLRELGCDAVLLKVGHLSTEAGERGALRDALATDAGVTRLAPLESVDEDVRGTGCQLSSALTAHLADGMAIEPATEKARHYLNELLHGRVEHIGHGRPLVVRKENSG